MGFKKYSSNPQSIRAGAGGGGGMGNRGIKTEKQQGRKYKMQL